MSIKIMTLVWDVEFPNLPAKMVALKLADCASDTGDSIFPSVPTIMRTTGCVQSTVRKWLSAMEYCGLLIVTERSAGGRARDTTQRRFDLALLKELADGRKKLIEDVIDRVNPVTGKAVSVVVFSIVDPDADDDGTPPPDGGVGDADPSAKRRAPLRQTEGTPPPDGPEPSGNRQGTSPPNPQGNEGEGDLFDDQSMQPDNAEISGWAKGWTEAAQREIADLFTNPIAGHVAKDFLRHVVGTLNPPHQADASAYVRQLRHKLQPIPGDVLRKLAERLIETRSRDLPATAQLVDQANDLKRAAEAQAKREEIVGAYPTQRRYVIDRNKVQWKPWMDHLRALGRADEAARADAVGAITVTHKLPQPAAELVAIGEVRS